MKILSFSGLGAFALCAASLIGWGCNPPAATQNVGANGKAADIKATSDLSGTISIDGSTTAYPILEKMVEEFGRANPRISITANRAGTGSGMQKFIRGEIDIVTASRPIDPTEIEGLKAAGSDFIEIPIAFDGLSIIVNKENTFVDHLTVAELKKAWAPNSTVETWRDIRPEWPAEEINFFGPTSNHGTFEYFTDAIVGEENQQRQDFQPNQEYNALVHGVATDRNAMGYVGVAYFEQSKDRLRAIPVDPGDGKPIAPTTANIADGTYRPLSRPLFLYVSVKALERPEVKAFLDYALNDGIGTISTVGYVELPADAYAVIRRNLADVRTGSKFQGVEPGMLITDVLAKGQAQ